MSPNLDELHKKWAEEYEKFLNECSSYFSEADYVSLLYHKTMYECIAGSDKDICLNITERCMNEMKRRSCKYSITRIIERIDQLDILNELKLPLEKHSEFFNFLRQLSENKDPSPHG